MRLSFDGEESFKEAIGSLNFNKPPSNSDPDSLQGVGSSSMPPEERNEVNPPSDPNIILEVWRAPVGSSSGTDQERSEDTLRYWNSRYAADVQGIHGNVRSPSLTGLTPEPTINTLGGLRYIICICERQAGKFWTWLTQGNFVKRTPSICERNTKIIYPWDWRRTVRHLRWGIPWCRQNARYT